MELSDLTKAKIPLLEVINNDPIHIREVIQDYVGVPLTEVEAQLPNLAPNRSVGASKQKVLVSTTVKLTTALYKDVERLGASLIYLTTEPSNSAMIYSVGELFPQVKTLRRLLDVSEAVARELRGLTVTQAKTIIAILKSRGEVSPSKVAKLSTELYAPMNGLYLVDPEDLYTYPPELAEWTSLNLPILINDIPALRPRGLMLEGGAGTGKEQPLDTYVQTLKGKVLFGSLQVGDKILGRDGAETVVLGIYPQGVKPSYKITFRDGTSTRCGLEHLWSVYTSRGSLKTVTLADMLAKGVKKSSGSMRFKIPLCAPVKYEEAYLPIDPYVLGCLIGDGCLVAGATPALSVAVGDEFISSEVASRLPVYLKMRGRKTGANCHQFTIADTRDHLFNELKHQLTDLKLNVKSQDKFIPSRYLHNSEKNRWELLQGLMDTDGSSIGNRISLSTTSAQLTKDVQQLVLSLGGTAIIRTLDRTHEDKGIEYSVNVKVSKNPFKLPRKAKNWRLSSKNPPSKYIESIDYEGEVEQMCIKVAAGDSLYLTDDYIVTHNTSFAKKLGAELGWSIFRLDIASSLQKYLGESEQTVRQHLQSVAKLSPCILLIDEVEKIFSGDDGTGSVTRILSYLLWWLAEHQDRVFTVMTSNNLDNVPPELYRAGRIDEVITLHSMSRADTIKFAENWLAENYLTLSMAGIARLRTMVSQDGETPIQAITYAKEAVKWERLKNG